MILEAEIVNDEILEAEVEGEIINVGCDSLKNKDVLNKFSEDSDGNLMYDGERIVSVPNGGAAGETLTKQSDEDYDFAWKKGVTLEYSSGILTIL